MSENKPIINKKISADESIKSLNKEKEELLKDIYVAANDNSGFYQDRASNVIAKFSSLLIILFREADESTKKMVRLTYAIFWLTVVLLVITICQLVVAFKTTNNSTQMKGAALESGMNMKMRFPRYCAGGERNSVLQLTQELE